MADDTGGGGTLMAQPAPAAATPPVFLFDPEAGDLVAFGSAEAAARHLQAWQEVGALAAYDARGRRIGFAVARRRERFLGILPLTREVVVVASVEEEPSHAADLARALVVSLARGGTPRAELERLPLGELVRRAAPVERVLVE
jgi:hypothetical protein